MKTNFLLIFSLFLSCYLQAQDSLNLSLDQAVQRAWQYSNSSKLASEKLNAAAQELKVAQSQRYPNVTLGGTYLYMTEPSLNLHFQPSESTASSTEEPTALPTPHHLLVDQAGIKLPLFSGFKIKNAVEAGKHHLHASQFQQEDTKADLAMQTVKAYAALYKARKTVKLIQQNLQTAQRRVTDLTAMEENGLLALNDLLKAKLQTAQIKLTLAQAQKSARILNYRLAIFLALPEGTNIAIDSTTFMQITPVAAALETPEDITRPDIQVLMAQHAAAEDHLKIAKGDYYPTIGLTASYLAADLQNVLRISNAMNVGVGISYNLSNLFKNKHRVHLAQSKAKQLQIHLDEAKDQASVALKNTREDYQLAIQNYKVYKTSKRQAEENYRIVKDKFNNGLLDTKDLLEADTQRLQSQIDLAVSLAEIAVKYYALQQATGSLITVFQNN